MKKKLFKTHLLTFVAFCGLALAFSSCANEDVAQSTTGTDNKNDKNLTTFVAGDEASTRTSMDYNTGNFYWEDGDKIWVKDDNGTWQQSSNAPTAKVASFKFKVPGKFTKGNTYKVYYPGKNGNRDKVTIPAAQTQTTPNTTEHFGVSGDCGTASASWSNAKNGFAFALDHQAAILVFQPYTNNIVLNDCYLTKIEVNSDNDIALNYTLDPVTGELTGTSTGKQIVLTTKGSGTYANGFPLTSTSSVITNGAYMLIKPGTHTLKIRYWVRDAVTNVEGTITKVLSSFSYDKNTFYDMTAALDVKEYDGYNYYMWDAQQNYWHSHEWDTADPWQTTTGSQYSTKYPKVGDALNRYYNTGGVGPVGGIFTATNSCSIAPNANEIMWYTMEGDPHWDESELWAVVGHLYKGGMWFKKKAYISGFRTDKFKNGRDYRTDNSTYLITKTPSKSSLSASEISKYFYLPALGFYKQGTLVLTGHYGTYWSSNALVWPSKSHSAYALEFYKDLIWVKSGPPKENGYRVQAFE